MKMNLNYIQHILMNINNIQLIKTIKKKIILQENHIKKKINANIQKKI